MNFKILLLAITTLIDPESDASKLLTIEDYAAELEEQKTPALSSGNRRFPRWESFNQWSCFETSPVLLGITNIDYDYKKPIPSLRVYSSPMNKVFELSPSDDFYFRSIFLRWGTLLKDARYVCILAAELPRLNHTAPEELWYVKKLKTEKGSWDIDEEPQLENDY